MTVFKPHLLLLKKERTQLLTKSTSIFKIVPPQQPIIGLGSGSAPREGQEYQLSCQSQGGNPEPNITWFRNEQQIVSGSLVGLRVEQTRLNGTTTNTLSWIPSIEDHNAVYKCSVWNKAMASMLQPLESETRMRVECKYAPFFMHPFCCSLFLTLSSSQTSVDQLRYL